MPPSTGHTNRLAHLRLLGESARRSDARRAVRIFRRLVALDGAEPWDWIELARAHRAAGDRAASEEALERAFIGTGPDDLYDRAVIAAECGKNAAAQGQDERALSLYRASVSGVRGAAALAPGEPGWEAEIAVSLSLLGAQQMSGFDFDAARRSLTEALTLRERAAAATPEAPRAALDFVRSLIDLADLEWACSNLGAALSLLRRAAPRVRGLHRRDPTASDVVRARALWRDAAAAVYSEAGRDARAARCARDAAALYRVLMESDRGDAETLEDAAHAYESLGARCDLAEASGEALAAYREAARLARLRLAIGGAASGAEKTLFNALFAIHEPELWAPRAEARRALVEALTLGERLLSRRPDDFLIRDAVEELRARRPCAPP